MEQKKGQSNSELLSDCCSEPVKQTATEDRCSKCGLLCYGNPKNLEISVSDDVGMKDVPFP